MVTFFMEPAYKEYIMCTTMKLGVSISNIGYLYLHCNPLQGQYRVEFTTQGKPCFGPVLTLYGIALCRLLRRLSKFQLKA